MISLSVRTMLLPVTIGPYLGGHGNSSGMSMEVGNQSFDEGPSYLEDYSGDNLVDYDGNKLEDYE